LEYLNIKWRYRRFCRVGIPKRYLAIQTILYDILTGGSRRQIDTGGRVTYLSGAALTAGDVIYVRFDWVAADNLWFTQQVNCLLYKNTLKQLKEKLTSIIGM
jgi:hypothetical protein